MQQIVTTIRISRPLATVFDYVTTPTNWPTLHPASLSVTGSADHPLDVGEEVTEEFIAAGRPGRTTWRVTQREASRLWKIETITPGARAAIIYRLHVAKGDTVFERDLTYTMPTVWLALLDTLLLRQRMDRESRTALAQLKAILDAPTAEGDAGAENTIVQ